MSNSTDIAEQFRSELQRIVDRWPLNTPVSVSIGESSADSCWCISLVLPSGDSLNADLDKSVLTEKPKDALTTLLRSFQAKVDAEERRAREKKEHEEAERRERRSRIEQNAKASWEPARNLVTEVEQAWAEAALAETAARDKQVEDELFGSGGSDVETASIWHEAQEAARKLLEFVQHRLDEAKARVEGTGVADAFEDVGDFEAEQIENKVGWVADEYGNEHTDAEEFQRIRQHEAEAGEEETEPFDDATMDELMTRSG